MKVGVENLSEMSERTQQVNPSFSDKNLYPKLSGSTRIQV